MSKKKPNGTRNTAMNVTAELENESKEAVATVTEKMEKAIVFKVAEEPIKSELKNGSSEIVAIQSKMGGEISVDDILDKVHEVAGTVDKIYVKPEENSAYYVKGTETGSVVLWD